jgi:hypothetical protein
MLEAANMGLYEKTANGRSTLGGIYLHAEHVGSRRVVTREREGAAWRDTPGWRFFRQILRVALYLRERAVVRKGDCIITLSRLRTERLVAEWAAVAQGVVVAPLGPHPSDAMLSAALEQLSPRMVFVGSPDDARRVREFAGSKRAFEVIVFDDTVAGANKSSLWTTACDLGGTLDTAERAQSMRAEMRSVKPEDAAVAYPFVSVNEGTAWPRATHANMMKMLTELWDRTPAEPGDVAYVVESPSESGLRLALWSLVADGISCITIGTPGAEVSEIQEIRPNIAVLPREVGSTIKSVLHLKPSGFESAWLDPVRVLLTKSGRAEVSERDARRPRSILALDGTRIR